MDYTSARTGGLFATLPQEIILKEITSKLTIPEMYSLRLAVNLPIPRESLPALFVRWTFLPRVRFNGIEGHVVSAYNIDWCLTSGICSRNSFTRWCQHCKDISHNLSGGIQSYNKVTPGSNVPLFEERPRITCMVTAMMAGIAVCCGTRHTLSELHTPDHKGISNAALMRLGVLPSFKDIRVLEKLSLSDRTFVLDDALVAEYAASILNHPYVVASYLSRLWSRRLPDDPKVYEIISSDTIQGHVLRNKMEIRRVLPVLLETCYLCNKCKFLDILRFGADIYAEYLRHRADKHPNDKLSSYTQIPIEYKDMVTERMDLLFQVYDPMALTVALTTITGRDLSIWRAFRDAIPEQVFVEELYSQAQTTALSDHTKHLINPNGATLSKIMRGIERRDFGYLYVVANYGQRGTQILQDPRNARKLKGFPQNRNAPTIM